MVKDLFVLYTWFDNAVLPWFKLFEHQLWSVYGSVSTINGVLDALVINILNASDFVDV